MKWHKFKPLTPGNRQKLPKEKKYVLCKVRNLSPNFPNPIVVGYLKFHAGDRSEPFFVTPGCSIDSPRDDSRVIEWCDCLPDNFVWPIDEEVDDSCNICLGRGWIFVEEKGIVPDSGNPTRQRIKCKCQE